MPDRRGQGLGCALLAASEQVTRERGGELMEMDVGAGDVDARRSHERHGYRNTGTGSDEQLLYCFRALGP